MTRRERAEALKLLQRLRGDAQARLVPADGDAYEVIPQRGARKARVAATLVRSLVSSGLLAEAEPGRIATSHEAEAWLKRDGAGELAFRVQHDALAVTGLDGEAGATVLRNLEESPVAALVRRTGRGGEPWLATHEVAAAERLRRDFELGRLQPRITANWSASISTGRRTGDAAGIADLTDMALSARRRFDRAMQATGPEFSGVLIDICCFVKGLELVERERQWPARSAKLALRLALGCLARHYGLTPTASGPQTARGAHHWGAEDYRPRIS